MISWLVGPSGLRPAWGLLVFAASASLLGYLLFFALPLDPSARDDLSSEVQIFCAEGNLLLVVLGGTAVMAWIERRGVRSYGLGGPRPLQRFGWGALWGVVLLSGLVGGLVAARQVSIEGRLLQGIDVVTYGVTYAAGFVIAAVAEEMQFRGYAQTTLARIVGFWPAAILLSLAFGLIHLRNAGESGLALATAILAGLVFSLCLRLSGSLWWGIGFHAAWNWAQAFLYGVPVSGYVFDGRLLQSRAAGDPLWSGGIAGPEASVLALPTLCVAALIVAWTFGRALSGIERGRPSRDAV
jgi:uncharacterized protein